MGDAAAPDAAPPTGAGEHDAPKIAPTGKTINVPEDAPTIQAGVDRAQPGDLVLVAPGVYKEAVTVTTDGIVIRGVNRNTTILDGEFTRDNGIFVVGADGVAVENLTARNYKVNGFFWNAVLGYRGSYLTAYRNGDYGIYAYDSQYGQFDHSYASGSPDSGFYIGQCNPCHAVITDVVSEYNLLGYSGSNSSNDLFIVNSQWRHNRSGIVPNSIDSEELPPQGGNTIAGNLVADDGNLKAARPTDDTWSPAFGFGIIVFGGVDDTVTKNRVIDSARVGLGVAANPGLQENSWPATGNRVTDNVVERSGLADLGSVLISPGRRELLRRQYVLDQRAQRHRGRVPVQRCADRRPVGRGARPRQVARRLGEPEGPALPRHPGAAASAEHAAAPPAPGLARRARRWPSTSPRSRCRPRRADRARHADTASVGGQRWRIRARRAAKQSPKLTVNTTSSASRALPSSPHSHPVRASERRPPRR